MWYSSARTSSTLCARGPLNMPYGSNNCGHPVATPSWPAKHGPVEALQSPRGARTKPRNQKSCRGLCCLVSHAFSRGYSATSSYSYTCRARPRYLPKTRKVCKTIAQNIKAEPKRQESCILLGSRYELNTSSSCCSATLHWNVAFMSLTWPAEASQIFEHAEGTLVFGPGDGLKQILAPGLQPLTVDRLSGGGTYLNQPEQSFLVGPL